MHAYLHACIHTYVCIYTHIHMSIFDDVCMCVHTYICIYTCLNMMMGIQSRSIKAFRGAGPYSILGLGFLSSLTFFVFSGPGSNKEFHCRDTCVFCSRGTPRACRFEEKLRETERMLPSKRSWRAASKKGSLPYSYLSLSALQGVYVGNEAIEGLASSHSESNLARSLWSR